MLIGTGLVIVSRSFQWIEVGNGIFFPVKKNLINKYGIMETAGKNHNSGDFGKIEFGLGKDFLTIEISYTSIVYNRLLSLGNFIGLRASLCSGLKFKNDPLT